MKLNLKALYRDILNNQLTHDTFEYVNNRIRFDVFFDIGTVPFKLVFIKQRSDLFLILKVKKGFELETFLSLDDLNILKQMLEITKGKSQFSTTAFFREFNSSIPITVSKRTISKRIISRIYQCEDEDRIYIKTTIDWVKLPNSGRHVSCANREKTRLLYPDIYECFKDKDISVVYTANPHEHNPHPKLA